MGPLQPQLPGRLRTANGRIDLAVAQVLESIAGLRAEIAAVPADYLLIGRRHVRDNNSWMHNFHRLVKGRPRCTLMINPTDAEREGLTTGDEVALSSSSGTINVPIEVSDEIMSGVLSLPHGYGHTRSGTRMEKARQHAGVSCNDVTDAFWLDGVSGNAAVNGVPVRLHKQVEAAS
jgi:anaerobic selenocysteine-containing dehydrogenase